MNCCANNRQEAVNMSSELPGRKKRFVYMCVMNDHDNERMFGFFLRKKIQRLLMLVQFIPIIQSLE